MEGEKLFLFLLERAAAPYLQMLSDWLYFGYVTYQHVTQMEAIYNSFNVCVFVCARVCVLFISKTLSSFCVDLYLAFII